MKDVLFLTWIAHRRTQNLCKRLDIPLVELTSGTKGARRYASLTTRTLQVLLSTKPRVLIVQSPSVVLVLLCLLLRPVLGFSLIVDAHNEAIEPYLHPSPAMRWLTRWMNRKADHTVVSNSSLAAIVDARGGRSIELPDCIPELPAIAHSSLAGQFRVVLIATFANDEPISEVFEAMRRVGPGFRLYVTGNPEKLPRAIRHPLPDNVTLTGFLREEDYWSTLAACDAIMDLTTMPDCLVCGAYEGIALSKPLILSANEANRTLFGRFCVFTENNVDGISNAIKHMENCAADIRLGYASATHSFERQWQQQAEVLVTLLQNSGGGEKLNAQQGL